MTDENLNLLISALSTPCWDLCDKTRLEIFDMAKELKWRRSAEKENAVTSTPPSDKNPAGAICEPLRELFAAREKLKSLPEPCAKFKYASIKEWIAKLNEEVGEVVEALYELEVADTFEKVKDKRLNLLRELVDVSTVVRSLEYASGFSKQKINEMQLLVNAHNRERGYMEASEK